MSRITLTTTGPSSVSTLRAETSVGTVEPFPQRATLSKSSRPSSRMLCIRSSAPSVASGATQPSGPKASISRCE